MWIAPSKKEYCVCRCRWVKSAIPVKTEVASYDGCIVGSNLYLDTQKSSRRCRQKRQAVTSRSVMCRGCRVSTLLECACSFPDRKSTRLNSSHSQISYAVFCLKKKIKKK